MPTFVVLRQDSNETVIWHTGTHNDYGILKKCTSVDNDFI